MSRTITRPQLADLLRRVNHATFVGFTALTRVKTPVDAPPLWKLSRVNACCGSYAAAVERRQAKEGNPVVFERKPRKWGHHVSLALVEHTKDDALKHYLSARVLKAKPPIYLVEMPPLRPGKRPRLIGVDKAAVAHLLPKDRTAEVAVAQGLSTENAVIHRDWSLDSISAISINGEVCRVED